MGLNGREIEERGRRHASREQAERMQQLMEVLPKFFWYGECKITLYQLRKKNGQVIDVLLPANGFRDAEGNIIRSEATMIDVTIQKRYDALSEIHEMLLKESERKYRAIKHDDHYILVAVARDETENLSYQEAL